MRLSTSVRSVAGALALAVAGMSPALAATFSAGPLAQASGPASPFAACTIGGPGTNYVNAEVEPYVDVNPRDANNIIGVFQQDRWSNGGAHGLVAAVSHDGGATWSHSWAPFSECSGGTAANGGNYQRASDPWISFAPNGDAYQISISFDQTTNRSSVLVSKSSNGGDTWSDPTTLILDNFLNVFNDKESITADATTPDGSHAYAVWDRFVSPSQNVHSLEGVENSRGFKQPVWFSRTTNGGRSWEAARAIFDAGDQTATEGNQIVVLPDGTLIDGFVLFSAHKDAAGILGDSIAVIRSTDKGLDWSHAIIVDKAFPVGIVDPNTGVRLRTGGDLPEFAVDPHSGALYAVWADGRFTNFTQPEIAFSMSTDGGLHWTPAVRVNKTPTGPAFTPMVRVAADGTVGVTYYDFRNNVVGLGNPLPTDAWMVHCHSACTDPGNWSETHVGGPFDEQQAPVTGRRGYFVGDYEGLTVAPNGGLRPFFAMALPGTLADRTNIFTNRVGP